MKPANEYPVAFGYLETAIIAGKPYTHRGVDRKTPVGTPIIIGITTIGLTGNTGLSTGPHLHIQVGTDSAVQNTINPAGHEFLPGTVTNIRTIDSGAWGKFVTIKNIDGTYTTYAHLDNVNVNIGQIIEGVNVCNATETDVKEYFKGWLNTSPTATQINYYTARWWRILIDDVHASYKLKRDNEEATLKTTISQQKATIDAQTQQIKDLQAQLALVGEDTTNLNKLGESLTWFIKRIGLK